MYRSQFLLTRSSDNPLKWKQKLILGYNLFYHKDLEITSAKMDDREIFLLGNIYDWENPQLNNLDICNVILEKSLNINKLLDYSCRFAGEYVIIAKFSGKLYIFNDACGQNEIYYDTGFNHFGSQVKIIDVLNIKMVQNNESARQFYTSRNFLKKRIFVHNTTHYSNIMHLQPNHYIYLSTKSVHRFFPCNKLQTITVDEIALKAARMLKGYLESISFRNPVALGVTAGYDSRILFLASLQTDSKYFIFQHPNMNNNHYDLVIARKLTSLYNRKLQVIPDDIENPSLENECYKNSIDFPRFLNISEKAFPGHIYINGNISEIARNYYGYHKKLNGAELSSIYGYARQKFPVNQYNCWLKENLDLFNALGYNYLDMFYWEEKMGNWAAKVKTESKALGREMQTPFNSRALINLLLSSPRKFRDSHFNILYDKIIDILAEGDPQITKLPVNPCFKTKAIKLMKKIKIFNLYRFLLYKFNTTK